MTPLTDTVRNEEVLSRTDAEKKRRKYQIAYFGRVTQALDEYNYLGCGTDNTSRIAK